MQHLVGHRGAAGYAPENTLLSFAKAIELGCHAVEFDVRLSRDGVAVVIHDAKVNRVTNGHGKVSRMTWAELRALRCPLNQNLPTLEEVVALCKGQAKMFIEIKAAKAARPVVETIRAHKLEQEVVVLSFNARVLKHVKKLEPRLRVCLLYYRKPLRLWSLVKSIPLNYIGPRFKLANARLVAKAHRLRRRVFVYGVNDMEAGTCIKEWRVDAVCTDFPILFQRSPRR